MKVIICGAGQVGSSIARQLVNEQNDVTVIDQSPELIAKISDSLDVKTIVGFASYPGVLETAGASDADMLIAVTFSDEVNMIACQVAHSLFQVPMKIARIRQQQYLNPLWNDLYRQDHLPIDVIISPEVEVAKAVLRRLHVPGTIDMIPFGEGRLRVLGVHMMPDCPVNYMPVEQVMARGAEYGMAVVAVMRDGQLLLPEPEETLLPGDDVYFVVDALHIKPAMRLMGHEEKEARRVVVVGGGNIGMYLAGELDNEGHAVKIIEVDRQRAEYIAGRLQERVTVIHGSALDREILDEANIEYAQTVVCVTNNDEVNIFASLLTKRAGCPRAISLVNNLSYMPLVGNLGIDVMVSPRETTISEILKHVRRGKVFNVHSIGNGQAEIVEAEALDTSSIIGKPLSALSLPRGVRMVALVREGDIILPKDDTVIQAHDHIVMVSLAGKVKKMEKYFSVQLEFF